MTEDNTTFMESREYTGCGFSATYYLDDGSLTLKQHNKGKPPDD